MLDYPQGGTGLLSCLTGRSSCGARRVASGGGPPAIANIELPIFRDSRPSLPGGVGESNDGVQGDGARRPWRRPLATPGPRAPPVVRAVIEHGLDRGALPVKLCYAGPFFRRASAGRSVSPLRKPGWRRSASTTLALTPR